MGKMELNAHHVMVHERAESAQCPHCKLVFANIQGTDIIQVKITFNYIIYNQIIKIARCITVFSDEKDYDETENGP